jgi:hypothetical protein
VQLAGSLGPRQLETAVNEADKLGLVDSETLRTVLEQLPGEPGVPLLRGMLDRHTFALTDSELERGFLPLARRAGLPVPLTGHRLNGFRVDFFWADLGLVVETDGLTYLPPDARGAGPGPAARPAPYRSRPDLPALHALADRS